MPDADGAAVGGDCPHQQAEGGLAPAQHGLAAVRHMQLWQLRHAPLHTHSRYMWQGWTRSDLQDR